MKANTKENKTDWNNIFVLDEFLTYFSLISRLVRNKLLSKLFFNATLSNWRIFDKFNVSALSDKEKSDINDYFKYWNYTYTYDKFKDKWDMKLLNNPGLLVLKRLLKEGLNGISKFIINFSVDILDNGFYFISPIVLDLINLARLNLYKCTFPLLTMLRIGEHLNKLKILNLHSVNFVVLTKQELSPGDAYLPHSLEELSIGYCKLYNVCSVPNTLSLAQYRCSNNIKYDMIHLQGLKIPSLKKLTSKSKWHIENVNLLKSNPQIEELTVIDVHTTQSVYDLISISEKLTNITILAGDRFPYISKDKNFVVPKFNYINKLKLQFSLTDELDICHSKSIINYFPNLTQLILDISDSNLLYFYMYHFIEVNLSSINKLDKLILKIRDIDSYYYENCTEVFSCYDWRYFTNLNCLILDIDIFILSEFYFGEIPSNLKEIRIYYNDKPLYMKYIKENISDFQNWNIEFKSDFIYFTK
ncbi:hypothetical protein CONCODRAFT_171082 [Conidiobolus coronatus NRRL 28638]|uniref:F-box domain-containing protein n=1 Tax=Conidiobolus coronatus (strain ATCC 28846 / CBS 209.66 / NRRL 28638) TaxID=796925 RepID=A0A137NPE0_CONC2|nr:hypothetical protein CONCODRAFT_171082 [Conidiobolus coronatus NRRL 28638]|eukprot:KXN64603.1 hypothetical protein CONCODRAFT_171082 [Conidiobolus coronatus NRRL 28638]